MILDFCEVKDSNKKNIKKKTCTIKLVHFNKI
jgi:hypothetical protein